MDDEEDDPGEDNGNGEPSLGWTEGATVNAAAAIMDGEEGSLSVAELEALRAKRRDAKRVAGDCSGSTLRITPPLR